MNRKKYILVLSVIYLMVLFVGCDKCAPASDTGSDVPEISASDSSEAGERNSADTQDTAEPESEPDQEKEKETASSPKTKEQPASKTTTKKSDAAKPTTTKTKPPAAKPSVTQRPTTKTTAKSTQKPVTTKKTTAAPGMGVSDLSSSSKSYAAKIGMKWDTSLNSSNSHWVSPLSSLGFNSAGAFKAKINERTSFLKSQGFTNINITFEKSGNRILAYHYAG